MADTVRARLGGIAARQLPSLNVQTQKLKESFDALFRDINLEGFLTALRTITALFSQNTVTGRALKSLIQGIVQPLIDGISAAAPYAKRFFQGMLLGFLSIGITVLKLRKWFRETFGDSGVFSGLISLNTALKLGQLFVYGLAAAFVGLAMAIAMVTAPIWTALVGLMALYKIGKAAINYLISIDWGAVGDAIVMGLVDGLKLAGKLLLGPALSGLAESAWNAFRSALGIASPSKEFAKLGLAIPQGVAAGVEQGTPTAQGAVQSMVETPGAGGAGAGGRGPALTIGELHFHAANGSQSKDMVNEWRAELGRLLTGLAVSLGAPVAGGA
jgi:hypothetical protein